MATIYRRLRSDVAEIRLLEMIPQENRENLTFRFHQVILDQAPKFCALSYAWGKPGDLWHVNVDDHTLWIRTNLWSILKYRISLLRYFQRKPRQSSAFDSPYIWVDAICINQVDYQERASQILLMGRIYQTGIVAVCLDSKESDQAARRILVRLGRQPVTEENSAISEDSWEALYECFTQGWFSRMWCIQEFVSPTVNYCQLWLDNCPLNPADLWQATQALFGMNPTCLDMPQRISMRSGMAQYLSLFELTVEWRSQREQQDWDPTFITTLLWIFRNRGVTDPRDKIYSLLGVLEETNGSEGCPVPGSQSIFKLEKLIIDYEAPVEDVYASLVDCVVSSTRSLNIICASQQPSLFKRSWVPNWAEAWQRYSFLTSSIYKSYHHIRADIDQERYCASASIPSSVTFSSGRTSLIVRGFKWDRILCLRDPAPFPPKDGLALGRWSNETFSQLGADITNRFKSIYGKTNVLFNFYMAIMAGLFDRSRNRGVDYRGFHIGASSQWHEYCASLNFGEAIDEEIPDSDAAELDIRHHLVGYRRKICVGNRGYCGLVPDSAQVGDIVCVLFGCDVPVVLRELETNKFSFVGESYIHGIMHGEAVECLEQGGVTSTELVLI